MNITGLLARFAAAALALTALATPALARATTPCVALAGAKIEAARIERPTSGAVVLSAAPVETAANGAVCKVLGAIRPVDPKSSDIRFQLNLPVAWNHKALHIGGGGYNGALIDGETSRFPSPSQASPLHQGYATFGSDSGHQTLPGGDAAAFAADPEAMANFAGDQLKKTHDVAVALIRLHYGAAPRRMYFQGNSQGGHEGLTVAQRWPADYDGVIAIHPVYDFTALQVDGVLLGRALYADPAGWISPAQAALVHERVMKACDGLDGLEDGLVSNVAGCRAAFHAQSLACSGAPTSDAAPCLTAPQLQTLAVFDREMPLGVTLAGGIDRFRRWPVLEGAASDGRFNPFGRQPTASVPAGRDDSFLYMMGDQMARNMVLHDPAADSRRFDPRAHAAALKALSIQMDASDPDLTAFAAKGGKLLLMHGTVDMAVTPHNTIAYWNHVGAVMGEPGRRRFARFYVAPGFGHGDGPFVVGWDSLKALDDWADRGIAPPPQVAFDTNAATKDRGRPLCESPGWPRYQGGVPTAASSFTCVSR